MFKKVVREYSAKRIVDEASSESSVPSIIGTLCNFVGDINESTMLDVFGKIEGSIKCKVLTIRNGGDISGNITAQYVKISGKFRGKIVANVLHMTNGCDAECDIEYGVLSVEEKAKFVGSSKYNEDLIKISDATV